MRAIALVAGAILLSSFIVVPPVRAAEPCADVPDGVPVHEVCIVVEPNVPPVGGNVGEEDCGLFVIIIVADGSASVCIGVLVNGTLTPPEVDVDPPQGPGDLDIEITEIQCGFDGTGQEIRIGDTFVSVCTDFDAGSGGAIFGIDVSGCPGGADPRVDLLGFFIAICVIVDGKVQPPGGPGVEVPPLDDLVPDVDVTPCPGGLDPSVHWMGLNATVCINTNVTPPTLPDIDTETCDPGETGLHVIVAGTRVGACAS